MRLVILEGARCVGKSTIARSIREKISEITLVNPTGFHLDNEEGLRKITKYYKEWINMVSSLHNLDSVFVFDRFFFTERVFSELYKSYDFRDYYYSFLEDLCDIADIDVIFFTINDKEELKNRLQRDKIPFGKVTESTDETLKQQNSYTNIMAEFEQLYTKKENVRLHRIDTSHKSVEEIQKEVFGIVGGK